MKVSIGDSITARGHTYMVGEIIYQDCFDGNYDVEFFDPSGGYHHWKSEFDGGHIISKEKE